MPVRQSNVITRETDSDTGTFSDIQRSGVTTTPLASNDIASLPTASQYQQAADQTAAAKAGIPYVAPVPPSYTDQRNAYLESERPYVSNEPPYQESTMAPNAEIQALEQQNLDMANALLEQQRLAKDAEIAKLVATDTDRTYSGGVGLGETSTTTTTGGGSQGSATSGSTGTATTPTAQSTGTGTSGDELVAKALSTKFEWSATTDADYKIAATDLENDIAQKMIGRGGLWSSVTQSALQSGLVKLQSVYRNQAYENYKDNRNFLMQVAQMQYGREDEAWNRNMAVLKFNADREDAAFSKQMALQNQADARANAKFNRDMAMAQQVQNDRAKKLNMDANTVASNYDYYSKLLESWKSSGRASKEVAAYFGVAEGTSVSNAYAISAIDRKLTVFDAKQQEITDLAYEYNQDGIYLEGIQKDYFMANPEAVDIYNKDVTQLGGAEQGSNYFQALSKASNMTSDQIYQFAADVAFNYQASQEAMGDAYTARLISDLKALADKKAAQED